METRQITNTYDELGRVSIASNAGTTGVPTVVLTAAYNGLDSRTQLKATIASTLDFQNDYTYDNLQRQTQVAQIGQSGGNTVADKRLTFGYNAASFVTSIIREYKPNGTWTEVATTAFSYDDINRLTGIDHKQGGTSLFTPYAYTFDNANRITGVTSQDGTVTHVYDAASQLTSADFSYQTDQSFSFDDNGNWTMSGYSTGTNNKMLSDGVYDYEYDDDGNLVLRTKISNGSYTEYAWDHRNRLTGVTNRNSSDAILSTVEYVYDVFDRRITKSYDADGASSGSAVDTHFVYDVGSTHVLLEFDGSSNLLRRNLWADAVDQLMAVENSSNAISWGLSDISHTVRDMIDSNGSVQNHLKYDSFGNVTAESASAVDYLMGFGGMVRDEETGLHYAWHRYQSNGHWLSEDPIGFLAGDPNISRVTGNDPINWIDATGLDEDLPGDPIEVWKSLDGSGSDPLPLGEGATGWEMIGDWLSYEAGTWYQVATHPIAAVGGGVMGAIDGQMMVWNAATFHQIEPLNDHVNTKIEDNGGLYGAANVFAHIGAWSGELAIGAAIFLPTINLTPAGVATGAGGAGTAASKADPAKVGSTIAEVGSGISASSTHPSSTWPDMNIPNAGSGGTWPDLPSGDPSAGWPSGLKVFDNWGGSSGWMSEAEFNLYKSWGAFPADMPYPPEWAKFSGN